MFLSIILVSWNVSDLLAQCLASIYDHPLDSEFEVIVADNASTDDTVNMVRSRYPEVTLLVNSHNIGFAGGNNQAILESTGDYILLLNPDTEVFPGALNVMLQYLEGNPKVGAAGARVLNPDGTLQRSCFPAPTLRRELFHLLHLDHRQRSGMERWDTNMPRQVEVLLGACIMIRREALNNVGPFDESYFMFSEEVDLCFRIQQAGWQLYWVPQAQIVHYGGQSTQQVALEMFLQLYRGKLFYFRKHYGRFAGMVYKVILLLSSLFRLAITPLVLLESTSRRRQHLTLAARYWRLVLALPNL